MTVVSNNRDNKVSAAHIKNMVVNESLNMRQKYVAHVFEVEPALFNKPGNLPVKLMYGYLLHCSGKLRSFYDCGYTAGVCYSSLDLATQAWESERNEGTTLGRALDIIITGFNKLQA